MDKLEDICWDSEVTYNAASDVAQEGSPRALLMSRKVKYGPLNPFQGFWVVMNPTYLPRGSIVEDEIIFPVTGETVLERYVMERSNSWWAVND